MIKVRGPHTKGTGDWRSVERIDLIAKYNRVQVILHAGGKLIELEMEKDEARLFSERIWSKATAADLVKNF